MAFTFQNYFFKSFPQHLDMKIVMKGLLANGGGGSDRVILLLQL
jgi:hypothetical protein